MLTLTAMDCYFRPGEAVGLTPTCVVGPAPRLGLAYRHAALLVHPFLEVRPSKVGQFDESLILDTSGREWLGDALCRSKHDRVGPAKFVGFNLKSWTDVFTACAEELRAPIEPVCVLRHTGASDDNLRKLRSLPDIEKRGRWSDDSSVQRYEKSARALHGGSRLHPSLQELAAQCQKALRDVLMCGKPPPSWKGVRCTGGV